MSDRLRHAFEVQARACEGLGSPFMGRLCRLLAERLQPGDPISDRLYGWPGEIHPGAQSIPLRLCGALHALVLDGSDAGLASAYPPNSVPDDELWDAITAAFAAHETRLMDWLDQAPQTNEVRRSVAMITAACVLRARHDLPFVVSELGASAGLNLHFDRFALAVPGGQRGAADSAVRLQPDWDGPSPPDRPIEIAERAGVDLHPLDPGDPIRLLAYLWPDQPERLALTRAAIEIADTRPEKGDAADWLESRLQQRFPGRLHLVFHTIAWQYFPAETQARCAKALDEAGAMAGPKEPLARLSMEADGTPGSAALSLQIWDGSPDHGTVHNLGRIDYHGRFIKITRADWP
ncbi:DUF2332 family protein [Rhodobacterales bacterium HKCCE3408]|nr:DUF2332 family protein [Rhodobacterales bacterium HKCCE3408]